MKPSPVRYLIVLVLATIVSLSIFGVVLNQAHLKQQDEQTQHTAENAEISVSNYVYSKGQVPDSLPKTIALSPTISYQKLTADSYRFCATYKTSYIAPYHKGKNCQTLQAYFNTNQQAYVKNSDGSYTVCGVKTNYFDAEGSIIPPTFNTPNVVDVSNQLFIFSAGSQAFDENCNPLNYADLHIGDRVDVFDVVSPTNIPGPARSVFLERS